MAKFLLPYGSSRYMHLLLKQTNSGKHAHSMGDHIMTAKSPRMRIIRRNQATTSPARK